MLKLLSLQEKAHYERRAEAIRELHVNLAALQEKGFPTADGKESTSNASTISSTLRTWQ